MDVYNSKRRIYIQIQLFIDFYTRRHAMMSGMPT